MEVFMSVVMNYALRLLQQVHLAQDQGRRPPKESKMRAKEAAESEREISNDSTYNNINRILWLSFLNSEVYKHN